MICVFDGMEQLTNVDKAMKPEKNIFSTGRKIGGLCVLIIMSNNFRWDETDWRKVFVFSFMNIANSIYLRSSCRQDVHSL